LPAGLAAWLASWLADWLVAMSALVASAGSRNLIDPPQGQAWWAGLSKAGRGWLTGWLAEQGWARPVGWAKLVEAGRLGKLAAWLASWLAD